MVQTLFTSDLGSLSIHLIKLYKLAGYASQRYNNTKYYTHKTTFTMVNPVNSTSDDFSLRFSILANRVEIQNFKTDTFIMTVKSNFLRKTSFLLLTYKKLLFRLYKAITPNSDRISKKQNRGPPRIILSII